MACVRSLCSIFQKYATGKNVLILFCITQAVYFFMLMGTLPMVMDFVNGMKVFDLLPTGYTPQYAQSLLTALGEEGREFYLFRQLPIDMVYPGLFIVAYGLLLTYLFRKRFPANHPIFFLALVPVLAGVFDYLENIGIISMILLFPDFSPTLAWITATCSVIKSVCTMGFFILLAGGIVAMWVKKPIRS